MRTRARSSHLAKALGLGRGFGRRRPPPWARPTPNGGADISGAAALSDRLCSSPSLAASLGTRRPTRSELPPIDAREDWFRSSAPWRDLGPPVSFPPLGGPATRESNRHESSAIEHLTTDLILDIALRPRQPRKASTSPPPDFVPPLT